MKQLLIETLEGFGHPVFLQGSLNPDESFPEDFFTFWIYDAPETARYDNSPHGCEWGFWVYFYSSDAEHVAERSEAAKKALEAAGFVIPSRPIDVQSGVKSHTGVMFEARYYERYERN